MPEKPRDILQYMVHIYLGSESDLPALQASGALTILREMGISYQVSAFSAHRNPDELAEEVDSIPVWGIIIAAASLSAALAGTFAALTGGNSLIIGVALTHPVNDPTGEKAAMNMTLMPPGRPVAYAGAGEIGLKNAMFLAAQMLALCDSNRLSVLQEYQRTHTKPPQPSLFDWFPGKVEQPAE